jgi:DNA-directed RNA polymerase specialized sigma24 family protein
MTFEINARAPSVGREVIQAAAAGVQDAWDQIVDAYAESVWAVARRRQLSREGAAHVSQLTWLRLADQLGDVSPDAVGSWLQQTAERESTRVAHLMMLEEQSEARPA